jgi:hypothetical protein
MLLSRYNARDIEAILTQVAPAPPFPPARDRAAWAEVCAHLGPARVQQYIAWAEDDARRPIPPLPATRYLEFIRTGERPGYEDPQSARRQMLTRLALAECLEYQGRFLDPLLDVAWAICEESSWAAPAHQYELTDVKKPYIDLYAASTGLELAELDLLLGAELDPLLGKRIRHEIDRRLFRPYLETHAAWWLYATAERPVNNWTAVCNGNVVGAALYLEPDGARLAAMIAKAARSLDDYLATFDRDGGSSEGPGYWSYGFGNYVLLAHLLEQRTAGRVSFLTGEFLDKISQFPARTLLSHNYYVNFSDCDRHAAISPPLLAFLSDRMNLPGLLALARQQPTFDARTDYNNLTWALRKLFWRVKPDDDIHFVPAQHDWFGDMLWMVARADPTNPDALVLAAKGGHNDEMHNQNDLGTLIVQVNGEALIADPGRGRYTKSYFSEQRYEHFVNQSLGHSCPVPNGQPQMAGKQAAAQLITHQAGEHLDRLVLELKAAYPAAADLESLQRTIVLHRQPTGGWVELVDDVRFARGPGDLASVLITFNAVEIGPDAVWIRGERGALSVTYDAAVVTAAVETVADVDLAEGQADIRRIVFTLCQPRQTGQIVLQIAVA